MSDSLIVRPQPGPQTAALTSPADIVVFGGAAGGGKTYALLLEVLRHVGNPGYRGVIFRQTYPQIAAPGGLWDESEKLFSLIDGAYGQRSYLKWVFPSGAQVVFAHMQYEKDRFRWQGSQLTFAGFDEGTHFSQTQVFYLLSRLRSMSGIRPYMRITCNPDPESWLAKFIGWWIGRDGYPIQERAGVLRYFLRRGDEIVWGSSPEEAVDNLGVTTDVADVRSVTFIPSKLEDNKALTEADPNYRANLLAMDIVERGRLLDGNWLIKPAAGKVFNRIWFDIVDPDEVPLAGTECRWWDLAASERQVRGENPDYTAGVLMRKVGAIYYVMHVITFNRRSPADTDETIRRFAVRDVAAHHGVFIPYMVRWGLEPGSSGIRDSAHLRTLLDGFDASGVPERGDKIIRARPLSVQAELGNVKLVRGAWNEEFLTHMHYQPDLQHDDIMDASTGAHSVLAGAEGEGYLRSVYSVFASMGETI